MSHADCTHCLAIDLFDFHRHVVEKQFARTLLISPGRIFEFFVDDFVDCALQSEDFHLVKSFFFICSFFVGNCETMLARLIY
jgi:hypothetical protein